MAERPTTVIAAFFANLAIAIAKFLAFFFTGSSALLAEGFHSVADTGNQGLLLLGHKRAQRSASSEHPFGYGPEQFFWAFVVAIVLFALGALLSSWEGYNKLSDPHPIESPVWAFGVLGVAIVAESIAWSMAIKKANQARQGSWWAYIRRTKDAQNAVVLLEDTAAEAGLAVALVGVTLSVVTGDARWDALGSMGIGLILAFVSGLLAVEMRSLLIGESARQEDVDRIEESIRAQPRLERLIDLRTMHRGPEEMIVAIKLELESDLTFDEIARAVDEIESRIREAVPSAEQIFIEPSLAGRGEPTS